MASGLLAVGGVIGFAVELAVNYGQLAIGALIGLAVGYALWARAPRAKPPEGPPKPSAEPLRLLTALQREGRLLDFFMEDVQAYADADIGQAVRKIHDDCRAVLGKYLVLEPVMSEREQETVTVAAGFDPSAIVLTGNVTGQPPFNGTLKHAGWRAKEIKLPRPPEGQDPWIVMPAEVELQ